VNRTEQPGAVGWLGRMTRFGSKGAAHEGADVGRGGRLRGVGVRRGDSMLLRDIDWTVHDDERGW